MTDHDQRISRIKHLTALIKSTDHSDSVRHAAEHEGDRAAFHAHVDDLIDKHGEDHPLVQRGTQLREYVDHPQHQHPKYVRSAMSYLHDKPIGKGDEITYPGRPTANGDFWHPHSGVAQGSMTSRGVTGAVANNPKYTTSDGEVIRHTPAGSVGNYGGLYHFQPVLTAHHAGHWVEHPEERELLEY